MKKSMVIFGVMVLVFGLAAVASATSIIANPTFDYSGLTAGLYSQGSGSWAASDAGDPVPGWNVAPYAPLSTTALSGILNMSGNDVAYIHPDPGVYTMLTQWLPLTITQGTTYTFSADVQGRAQYGAVPSDGTFYLQFYALAPDFSKQPWLAQTYGNPTVGTFTTQSVTWVADSTYAGWTLGIALVGVNSAVGYENAMNYQMLFDNAQLTATAVPEPMTLMLLGSGLVGLAAMRRRIKK